MTDFSIFSKAVARQFKIMSKDELYTVHAPNLADRYLSAFPAGSNPVFRTNTVHDCSCCKNFIRNIGNVVSIKNGDITTVWDVANLPEPYKSFALHMAIYVASRPITGIFRSKERKYGNEFNFEIDAEGKTHLWEHLVGHVADKHWSNSPATVIGEVATAAQVLQRGLEEANLSAIDTVRDLIKEKALYRGEEFSKSLKEFREMHAAYHKLSLEGSRLLFVWENAQKPVARFRNTVMGTLISDLSTGTSLEDAVRIFESKVAPENYKRPTALITPRMIKEAAAKLEAEGLDKSIQRRFARISDVSVNDVLFVSNDNRGQMKDGIEGLLAGSVKPARPKTNSAQDVTIDDFISRIVPQADTIDLFIKNDHLTNFVALTAPIHEDAPSLFKWGNNFAWSYDGEFTDAIRERVKAAGGQVDGALRFSLAWHNHDDLDIYANTPDGIINFIHRRRGAGTLDVDMNAMGRHSRTPVENIVWKTLRDGDYCIGVNQYRRRETVDVGFVLQMAHDGKVTEFTHEKAASGQLQCVSFRIKNGLMCDFKASKLLTAEDTPTAKWGITTGSYVPVKSLVLSPNHWDGAALGNKHWFFLLEGCKNPNPARGIYNEFLRPDLEKHRKVFEVLGSKTKCQPSDDQLAGLGFSSTRNDVATVAVKGSNFSGTFNIQF